MQIGVIGINHKVASLSVRESMTLACQKLSEYIHSERLGFSYITLTTCNRCEIYFSSTESGLSHQKLLSFLRHHISCDFEQKLYTFFGIDCFLHLAKVTSGLDSALFGETEIQGQVRTSYETTRKARVLDRELHYLFQKCLQIGKDIRSNMQNHADSESLEWIVFNAAREFTQSIRNPSVLFIGASDINRKIAKFFYSQGITSLSFCNRTKISPLQQDVKADQISWESLEHSWKKHDWIVCATKCPSYILTKEPCIDQNYESMSKVFIDLSVPRNIDPNIVQPGWTLFNMDSINAMIDEKKQKNDTVTKDIERKVVDHVERKIASYFLKNNTSTLSAPC